jgi:pilus assembly protein CpaC
MPYLARLPIIGQLFRSDSFRAKNSDLVIFVTPLISDPAREPNTALLARAQEGARRYADQYGARSPLAAPSAGPSAIPVVPEVSRDAPLYPAH